MEDYIPIGSIPRDMSVEEDNVGVNEPTIEQTDFEPTAEDDDEFFVVVETDLLVELLTVYAHTDFNAVMYTEEDTGLRVRSRTDNCYWFEVDVPPESLNTFQTDGATRNVNIESLSTALSGPTASQIALHGKDEGTLVLRDGFDKYRIETNDSPFDEEPKANQIETSIWMNRVEFTIKAARFQALINTDCTHDHVYIFVDQEDNTVEFSFFDHGNDELFHVLSVSEDEFIEPPYNLLDGDIGPFDSAICHEAIDEAMPPMQGPITVGLGPLSSGNSIEYTRANEKIMVRGVISAREDAMAGLR